MDFYKDLSTHSSYSKLKRHGRLEKIMRIGVVVVLLDGDFSARGEHVAACLDLAYPGAVALGIQFLFFAVDLTSRAAPSCSASSDERSSSDSEKSVKREATFDSPLYL
ncbi:hypothetical protein ACOSQ2_022945 [Xanthoceras sorbifolium]